jgi:hypothetical protein
MRTITHKFLPLLAVCAAPLWALAQNAAPASGSGPDQGKVPLEQRIERIHLEDAGSRIDELRVGGETRSITVQPKGSNAPAYDIAPITSNQNPTGTDHRGEGTRTWKLLSY